MTKKIGTVLKEARIKAGISIEQISHILIEKGYKASIKTIYSWENGNSNPGPDALLEMCDIYKIENILKTFGYDGYRKDGSIQLNFNEIEHIEKYRTLDNYGKDMVDTVLDKEYTRCQSIKQQPAFTLKDPTPDYLVLNAAHERTDLPESERTQELVQMEEDIMDDDNF